MLEDRRLFDSRQNAVLQKLFELCNGAKPRHLDELGLGEAGRPVKFELIHYNDEEYKNKIVELFEAD